MKERPLAVGMGFVIIAGHLGSLALIFYYGSSGRGFDDMGEALTCVEIVGPMFASYVAIIVAYIIKHRHDMRPGRRVSHAYAALTMLLPVLFIGAVFWAVWAHASNQFLRKMDDLKGVLGAIEAIFGISLGQIVSTLYESTPEETQAKAKEGVG